MTKKKLGRGLQALLGDSPSAMALDADLPAGLLDELVLADLDPNPHQPRRDFDTGELAALAESIAEHGVIQPIVVRRAGQRFQIIAGERRFRAAQMAGRASIPARILDIDDREVCELALVENLQRQDLNAIEKAEAFQDYLARFGSTHEELAGRLGIDRSSVTNLIRLLELPETIQNHVRSGALSYGHARALLAVDDRIAQIDYAKTVIDKSLSVRQTEELVRDRRPVGKSGRPTRPPAKSNHLRSLEDDLRHRLGTKVEIHPRAKDAGTITIHFASNDDFERVIAVLTGRASRK